MQTIKLNGGLLTLPQEALRGIRPEDEFTVITAGDTIILKKVTTLRLSELAARAPQDKPMSLNEISKEVHAYRRSRRAH